MKGGGNLLADFVSFACRARNAEEGWVRPLPQLNSLGIFRFNKAPLSSKHYLKSRG